MKKYIKEEQTKRVKLSEYMKLDKSEFKYYLCDEKYREPRTKYIMEIIGDVELDEETYKLFIKQFQCCGGRYDVRTKRETIKGIYDLSQKYSFLSTDALEEIWFVYIHDQFEEYALDEVLGMYIDLFGKTDETLLKYIDYIDKTAKQFDKKFIEEASKLDVYCGEYDPDLIRHLQYIIKAQHISADKIISSLPGRELIEKDKAQLTDISKRTRIFLGACYPISYQMIESLATGEGLDYYPEQPKYLINKTTTFDTTFTKQEFIDSIQKEKVKKLEKK